MNGTGKIVLDKSGDLRKGVFYIFDVQFDDTPVGERPQADWIVVPRSPTDAVLRASGKEPWMYISEGGDSDTAISVKDCPVDPTHETHSYYTKFRGSARGGRQVSPIVPTLNFECFALSGDMKERMEGAKVRGARIDPIDLTNEDTDEKIEGVWALQFVARAPRRIPKIVDGPNSCGFCGKTKIICETCGHWTFSCEHCKEHMVVIDYKHGGKDDKRIPYEDRTWRILEGKSWDGCDLMSMGSVNYASKRFIDWLLRIHAAPFYAEPVWFCVEGMSDQQKKWFDELQKPFEV